MTSTYSSLELEKQITKYSNDQETILTIGVFDGVHKGHQLLFEELNDIASKTTHHSTAITFTNHPSTILNSNYLPNYIDDVDKKIGLIKDFNVNSVIPITFNNSIANLTAEKFMEILKRKINIHTLVLGHDFAMGKNRQGTKKEIVNIGSKYNFFTANVLPYKQNNIIVSTSIIKKMISNGEVHNVSKSLGRNFEISGKVIKGFSRGKQLGYPTANIEIQNNIIKPGNGIYATHSTINKKKYFSCTSIGMAPTFKEQKYSIETYILDFEKSIYSQNITIEFIEKLRDEIKFENIDTLKTQIQLDIEKTKTILNKQILRQPG